MERMTDYKPQERQELEELYRKQNVRINELEEENKKLKSDLAYERTMLDNVRAEYESLQDVNKKLKEEIERMKVDTMYDMKDINSLYKENKKLKSDLAETQKIGESWRQECKQLREDVDYRHHRCMKAERGEEDED